MAEIFTLFVQCGCWGPDRTEKALGPGIDQVLRNQRLAETCPGSQIERRDSNADPKTPDHPSLLSPSLLAQCRRLGGPWARMGLDSWKKIPWGKNVFFHKNLLSNSSHTSPYSPEAAPSNIQASFRSLEERFKDSKFKKKKIDPQNSRTWFTFVMNYNWVFIVQQGVLNGAYILSEIDLIG